MQKQSKKTNKNTQKQNKVFKQKLAIAIPSTIVATVLIITAVLSLATWGFTAESKADLWSFKKPMQNTELVIPTEPQIQTGQLVVGNTYTKVTIRDDAQDWTAIDRESFNLATCLAQFDKNGIGQFAIASATYGELVFGTFDQQYQIKDGIYMYLGSDNTHPLNKKNCWLNADGNEPTSKTYIFAEPCVCSTVQHSEILAKYFIFE